MADDTTGWTLEPAPAADTKGWTLEPAGTARAPTGPAPMSRGMAAVKGLQDIPTMGWGDEIGAGIQSRLARAKEVYDNPRSLLNLNESPVSQETYKKALQENRAESTQAKAEHPGYYYGAGLPAALATASISAPLRAAKGASLARMALTEAGNGLFQGAVAGAGNSEAEDTSGVAKDAARAGLAGGVLGGTLGAAGSAVSRFAGGKVAAIDETVAREAAAKAAAETASARSAAGSAAQSAYRQLEHLRELGGMRNLTPEEAQVAQQLEAELSQKAQANLLPEAARKEATSQAYSQAMGDEAKRAAALAADKLSAGEVGRQLKARAMRYGLPAAMGAAAGGMGFGGHGALAGAALGGALGNNFRPMLRSLVRMGSQPGVQRGLYSTLEGAGERAAPALESGGLSAEGFADWLQSHGGTPALSTEDEKTKARALALRGNP